MDNTSLSDQFRILVRDHVLSQSRQFSNIPTYNRLSYIRFSNLKRSEQRKIAASALMCDEFDFCNEQDEINKLIAQSLIEKKHTRRQAVNKFLDYIIKERSTTLEQTFDEEWENHLIYEDELRENAELELQIDLARA